MSATAEQTSVAGDLLRRGALLLDCGENGDRDVRSRNRPFKVAGHRAMRRVFPTFPSCPYRKSNPEILVMKSAENRPRQNHSSSLHCTWNRRILAQ
jgi:hypothetical protein